jgi:hypothetical protein
VSRNERVHRERALVAVDGQAPGERGELRRQVDQDLERPARVKVRDERADRSEGAQVELAVFDAHGGVLALNLCHGPSA